ncbi:DUF3408 domain-containing protein [Flavobacterium sp. HSC-61S13]|uniref:DUF3408 domain-containing protein n=1 Tax=Flavobacterium sp. HSC-61S13 TaxID=2910963 RepID=UPI00209F71AD|nr:DUF3408 domain-containing protein [Flavobacterium sp. HSC-61S13]MCP1994392.1 hypothetical protein [Flavobacterium sp. HSC-61S13]
MKDPNKIAPDLNKASLDEDYLMNVMSGDAKTTSIKKIETSNEKLQAQSKNKKKNNTISTINYQELFLLNSLPSSGASKVVYIRPDYHEVLIRITQLAKEEKTTLYSYLDNILKQHLKEYSQEITEYFNMRFKPIL